MAKSKRRRKPKTSNGDATAAPKRRIGWVKPGLATGALGLAVFVGFTCWESDKADAAFIGLAESGRAILNEIETIPSRGRTHLAPGQSHRYPHRFPTSGPHAQRWTEPGIYDSPQPAVKLVHALEHGNVVIYYDQPAPETMKTLEEWASMYWAPWSGLVLTPRAGLKDDIVFTAWTKRLRLREFDAAKAAAFIDAFRGRGPENRVR